MRSRALLLSALLLLTSNLWGRQALDPVDTYSSEFEKSPPDANAVSRLWLDKETKEKQDQYVLRVSVPEAVKQYEEAADAAITALDRARASAEASATFAGYGPREIGLTALFLLAGVLLFRSIAPRIAAFANARYNPWLPAVAGAGLPTNVLAEEKSFSEFVAAFRIGPEANGRGETNVNTDANALKRFFKRAPALLLTLRNLLQQVRPGPEDAARKKNLEQLRVEVRSLKGMAGLPELLPIWQMACAMEGLLNQLIGKAQSVTLSTLRTIAQAVDLLESLCLPNLKPDLATHPPIRLLAVDDDPISRHAISFALKKALNPPDLAPNGGSALPLCEKTMYDVIFLDVQMPGMDGFELCSKIHETRLNQATPVVFVTCQSDFEARAKSTLVGGHDLMGKPFLTFEITLKALTLVLRGRLGRKIEQPALAATAATTVPAKTEASGPAKEPAKTESAPTNPVRPAVSPAEPVKEVAHEKGKPEKPAPRRRKRDKQHSIKPMSRKAVRHSRKRKSGSKRTGLEIGNGTSVPPAIRQPVSQSEPNPAAQQARANGSQNGTSNGHTPPVPVAEADMTHHIRPQLLSLMSLPEADRPKILTELCVRLQALTSEAERIAQTPVFRLTSALQGLLKKLLEKPDRTTTSAIHTAGIALNLIDELRQTKAEPNLAEPPVSIMIVDDDPVARRAITGAIQLSFAKPVSIENGENAVAAAAEKTFDVIFLDVRMPGMDGFAAANKIRETRLNASTPIIFVTSHSDLELQKSFAASGGSGFIPKPALAVEVTLTALTHVLLSRVRELVLPSMAPAASASTART